MWFSKCFATLGEFIYFIRIFTFNNINKIDMIYRILSSILGKCYWHGIENAIVIKLELKESDALIKSKERIQPKKYIELKDFMES